MKKRIKINEEWYVKEEPTYKQIKFNEFNFEVYSTDIGEFMWEEAMEGGDDGWRLPTIDELRLMYLCEDMLQMEDDKYWSSSEFNSNVARYIYFINGDSSNIGKDSSLRVRLVRTIVVSSCYS
jgi:hypothetical protein